MKLRHAKLPLRTALFYRMARRVDHGECNRYLAGLNSTSRFHGIAKWRNAHQRRLAGRYYTAARSVR